jgi:hypothetical protein
MQYIPAAQGKQAFVALCLPLVFSDPKTNGPYAHATIERVLLDCSGGWLLKQDKLHIMPNMAPLVGGFAGITSRYRMAEAARIIFAEDIIQPDIPKMANQPSIPVDTMTVETGRIGTRMRVNSQWRPDLDGEFETVNEMQPGTLSLKDKSQHVQYMDTFVFEADECSSITYAQEQSKLAKAKLTKGHISANVLYTERLRVQIHEGERLFKEGKVCRIVYSGSKSYHMLVRISDPPTTLEQYKWIHGYLCTTLSDKLLFDPACADPARLTRAPVTVRRVVVKDDIEVVGMQQLRHVNWSNVLDLNWRTAYAQWQNRPMYEYEMAKGRRLRPCKKEYQDAMYSLLKGTFWTEPTWNGRRQQCFFPGYRLCRMLGYTHDELWAEGGILSGLENYYKRNEVSYWTSRVNCDLVKVIDTEVDQELEDV